MPKPLPVHKMAALPKYAQKFIDDLTRENERLAQQVEEWRDRAVGRTQDTAKETNVYFIDHGARDPRYIALPKNTRVRFEIGRNVWEVSVTQNTHVGAAALDVRSDDAAGLLVTPRAANNIHLIPVRK